MNVLILLLGLIGTSLAPAVQSLPSNTAVCLTEDALEDFRARESLGETGRWLCGLTDELWSGPAVVLEPGPRNSRIRLFTADSSTVAWVPTSALVR